MMNQAGKPDIAKRVCVSMSWVAPRRYELRPNRDGAFFASMGVGSI
ncbi:MAG: hypothetical protein K6C05_10000 [Anaerovibrio sp.]|nr:hypothetical protein [Anaerovibrio sp.]MCR5177166.1 hypothetical protein [Anaerovibrio sp.]